MKSILKDIFICVILTGVGISLGANFEVIANKISENKDKKVAVVQKQVVESMEDTIEETTIEEEKEISKKTNIEDSIKKARNAIIKQCGNEFSDVIYIGDKPPERISGNYYIFGINVDGEVAGDMMLYVDKNTFNVYEDSVDGYFGEFRTAAYYEEQFRIEEENKKTYSKGDISRLLVENQFGDEATYMDEEDTYIQGELCYMMDVTYITGNDIRRWDQVYVGIESLRVYNYNEEYLDTLK